MLTKDETIALLGVVERLIDDAVKRTKGYDYCPFCSYKYGSHDNECASYGFWQIKRRIEEEVRDGTENNH